MAVVLSTQEDNLQFLIRKSFFFSINIALQIYKKKGLVTHSFTGGRVSVRAIHFYRKTALPRLEGQRDLALIGIGR